MADRKATVVWNGGLADGSGTAALDSSGLANLPVSWAGRVEDPGGKSSPEEMLAAAHATCYAMSLSNVLGQAGHPPDQLRVEATFTAELGEGGLKITRSALAVSGQVSGIDQSGFQDMATQAEQACPVSNALRRNVDITVTANLSS